MNTISFISANYVARALGYTGDENWGKNDTATIAQTDLNEINSMLDDVKSAGFSAIDIWTGHCSYKVHADDGFASQVKAACDARGLQITSYAGGINLNTPEDLEAPFRVMQQLGAPYFAGGIYSPNFSDNDLAKMVNDACLKYGVKWAFENHPQKTGAEMLAKIGGVEYMNNGIALDTGWCGTQGLDVVEAAKAVRNRLFLLHLKDIKTAGGHETCAAGDGIVDLEGVVKYLKDDGWNGTICIEHEPFDRDPMPEVITSLQRLQEWLS